MHTFNYPSWGVEPGMSRHRKCSTLVSPAADPRRELVDVGVVVVTRMRVERGSAVVRVVVNQLRKSLFDSSVACSLRSHCLHSLRNKSSWVRIVEDIYEGT